MSAQAISEKKYEDAVAKAIDISTLNAICKEDLPNPPLPVEVITKTLQDVVLPKPDVELTPSAPPTPTLGIEYYISIPNSRFPAIRKRRPSVSTFLPTAFHYYEVIHYMDNLIGTNFYFERTGHLWHPFLSRMYFGALFYLQSRRASLHANHGSDDEKLRTRSLLQSFPPERLSVPGPLVPILQSIATCQTEHPDFGPIVPYIPPNVGPLTGTHAPSFDAALALPNLPVLSGFLSKIIDAEEDAIPDFTNPTAFSTAAAQSLNGTDYPANAWTQDLRNALLQPGMTHAPETTREIDATINESGLALRLPTFNDESHLRPTDAYFMLEDATWFDTVIPTMATYCSFFKESTTLASCSPSGPTSGLIRSRAFGLTSATAATNVVNTLTHAFPGISPYTLVYDHRSYESSIPQLYMLMGQFSAINTICDYRGLQSWSHINTDNDNGRTGPYWNIQPTRIRQSKDTAFNEIETIVSSHYYIDDPSINI